jgi:UDPglucose 6-dehydrogenase
MKVGIIGYGFVGKAVASAYDDYAIYDPEYPLSKTINELKHECDAIFVCVPTPQHDDGSCNADILSETVRQLKGYTGLVICKSTATPQVYAGLEQKYPHLKLVHAPEFLTARNAILDYQYPVNIVIGCKQALRQDAFSTIITNKINFDFTRVKFCTIAEAAMFKYVANTMLAMKVVINNEFYDLCNSLGISWDAVANIAEVDPRLGDTHWAVPGHDGTRGFGGGCFPKDTQAILSLAQFLNVDMKMLTTAINKNEQLRS